MNTTANRWRRPALVLIVTVLAVIFARLTGVSEEPNVTSSTETLSYTMRTTAPFDTVVANLEKQTAEHQFRVLHVHNVQATLAEKGLERGPLKIIEVCNAKFAYAALEKSVDVALFMPCKFTVYTEGNETVVSLAKPTMISQMMPNAGLDSLAANVENTLMDVMKAAL